MQDKIAPPSWESLIKDRMRPCIRLAEEDPGKRNQRNHQRKYARSEKGKAYRREYEQTPKRKAYKAEYEKRPERIAYNKEKGKKYRENHKEELNAKHREYNASEHGKTVNAATNKAWREKNKEYDKQRKAEWWRKTHPNPRPIGRPKKEQNEHQAEDCREG